MQKSCFLSRKKWVNEKLNATLPEHRAINHTVSTQSFFKNKQLISLPSISEKNLRGLLYAIQKSEPLSRYSEKDGKVNGKNFAVMRLELLMEERHSDKKIRIIALPFDDQGNLAYFESSEQTDIKTPRKATKDSIEKGKEYYSEMQSIRTFGIFDMVPGKIVEKTKNDRNGINRTLFDSSRAENLNHSEPGIFQALNMWSPEIWSQILQRAHKENTELFKANKIYKILGARIAIVSTRDMCRYCEVQMHHAELKNNVSGFILRHLKLPNGASFVLHDEGMRALQTQITVIGLHELTIGKGVEHPMLEEGTLVQKLMDYEPYVHLATKVENAVGEHTVPDMTHRTAFTLPFRPKEDYYQNNLKIN